MQIFSDAELLRLNQIGLIPGPGEAEEEFRKRVDYCLNLKQELARQAEKIFPESQLEPVEQLKNAFSITKKLFDIEPSWIPLFYSNHNLAPWHGGCAWIFQMEENSPTSALLQMRKAFFYKKRYLGIYQKDEVISHELSHVGRMVFQEPEFEEIIAYQTSDSCLRRFLGPIITSARETLVFVSILVVLIILDFFTLSFGRPDLYEKALWLKLIPIGMVVGAFGRLFWRQSRFKRCLAKLKYALKSEDKAHAVIYRLTDTEINAFARGDEQDIRKLGDGSLRWRLIAIILEGDDN